MKAILNLHSMAITSILYLCQKVGAINAFVVHFCYFNVSQCARIFEPSSFLSQTRIYCLAMAYCSHTYVCMYVRLLMFNICYLEPKSLCLPVKSFNFCQ